jgi:hypothetical protein
MDHNLLHTLKAGTSWKKSNSVTSKQVGQKKMPMKSDSSCVAHFQKNKKEQQVVLHIFKKF